jgi:D-arabinose 1-dehydrogenase-like Zn-dependent alcohol dehydrogenase
VLNLYHDFCGICDHCLGGDERRCRNIREFFGLSVNGGYAEYVLASERALEAIPEAIPYDMAATLMSATGVGFHNTANTAGVHMGEDILVTGATGGVGSAAVQTAKLLRARVWAVTSNEDKVKFLEQIGVDHVIVNADGRFHKGILDERNGQGLDAAIDCVGAPTFNGSLRSLRPQGRAVIIGNVDGRPVQMNLGFIIINRLRILGSDNVTRAALRQTMELVSAGKLNPTINKRMPLERAREAHGILEAKGAVGRIVLIP